MSSSQPVQRPIPPPTTAAQVLQIIQSAGTPNASNGPFYSFGFTEAPESPIVLYLPDGRRVAMWTSTRLHFKRRPIEELQAPDDLIIIRIEPTPPSVARGYQPGWFVMTKDQFDRHPDIVRIRQKMSWGEYGAHNYVQPPKFMPGFFI